MHHLHRHFRVPTAAALAALAALFGCESAPLPAVDLAPARSALTDARSRASSDEAKQCLARAEEDLRAAEGLSTSTSAAERQRASGLAATAAAGAACVDRLESQARRLSAPADGPAGPGPGADAEKMKARLKKSAEEQRKLEERLALLQHDLETTENEVIRTKAKMKGIETKADASSAIAEAQTLVVRSLDGKSRTPNLTFAQEKLGHAERQLADGNYGAAVFFALQAQDLLGRAPSPRAAAHSEGSGPGPFSVAVASANVRTEPRADAPIVARLPRGTSVIPLEEAGGWLKIEVSGRPGWIARSVVR